MVLNVCLHPQYTVVAATYNVNILNQSMKASLVSHQWDYHNSSGMEGLLLAGRELWMFVTIACHDKDQAVLSLNSFSSVDQRDGPFKQNIS